MFLEHNIYIFFFIQRYNPKQFCIEYVYVHEHLKCNLHGIIVIIKKMMIVTVVHMYVQNVQ